MLMLATSVENGCEFCFHTSDMPIFLPKPKPTDRSRSNRFPPSYFFHLLEGPKSMSKEPCFSHRKWPMSQYLITSL